MIERATHVALAALLALGCASNDGGDGRRRDGSVGGGDGSTDAGPSDCAREGDPCDADGDGCTQDLCRGGECIAGEAATCDDGASCTLDRCVSTGPLTFMCERDVSEGCGIDGGCQAEGDRDPARSCRVCDPTQSTSSWSNADGACDDGDVCTVNDACRGGHCEGEPRLDDFESNDDMVAPAGLGGVSDGDDFPSGTLQGSIYPEGDVDWFVYNDSDDTLSSIFPRSQLINIPSGSDYDLCLFVQCESSFDSLSCTAGSPESFGGLSGCCSRNGGSADENVRIDHNCSGVDDSADIFVRITKAAGPPVCDTRYTLRYGDD